LDELAMEISQLRLLANCCGKPPKLYTPTPMAIAVDTAADIIPMMLNLMRNHCPGEYIRFLANSSRFARNLYRKFTRV
jgi:hypothetical protein